jgi:wyosine [tRNA(Phe)-imidazoG37] synthetase (radical SAM superfamily)
MIFRKSISPSSGYTSAKLLKLPGCFACEPTGCTLVLSGDPIMKIPAKKEIGRILDITERTVKFHVSNILSKLGLERRTELVRWHEPI